MSIVAISISKQNSSLSIEFIFLKLTLVLYFAGLQDTLFATTILILSLKEMIGTRLLPNSMKLASLKISSMVLTLILDNDAKAMRKVVFERTKISVSLRVKFSVFTFLIAFVDNTLKNRLIRVFDLMSDRDVRLIVLSQLFYLFEEKSIQLFQVVILSNMFLSPTLSLPHKMVNIYSCNKAISIGIISQILQVINKLQLLCVQIIKNLETVDLTELHLHFQQLSILCELLILTLRFLQPFASFYFFVDGISSQVQHLCVSIEQDRGSSSLLMIWVTINQINQLQRTIIQNFTMGGKRKNSIRKKKHQFEKVDVVNFKIGQAMDRIKTFIISKGKELNEIEVRIEQKEPAFKETGNKKQLVPLLKAKKDLLKLIDYGNVRLNLIKQKLAKVQKLNVDAINVLDDANKYVQEIQEHLEQQDWNKIVNNKNIFAQEFAPACGLQVQVKNQQNQLQQRKLQQDSSQIDQPKQYVSRRLNTSQKNYEFKFKSINKQNNI